MFEQLGYQHESPSVRNSYLSAAFELRNGIPSGAAAKTDAPDLQRAMTTGQFLDFIGIRMDSKEADGMAFTINFINPDVGESYVLEMSNGALTNIKGQVDDNADLTITVNRSDLETILSGEAQLSSLITGGSATLEGNPLVLGELISTLKPFPPRFAIMPGTESAE